MRLALHEPDIAGNVGTLIRTATCFGVAVDLIEPMGFPYSDRALARSAMDYAALAEVVRHADWDAFRAATRGRIVLATTLGAIPLPEMAFRPDDVILLGSEGAGVPEAVHDAADIRVRVPMRSGVRSLNVAITGGILLAEARRQTGWAQMPG
ncbi:tRNA (cytidine(34)-2'-O)-methyltransferase [Sphingomonas sanguinis]|jgi:tRNA (cytidine/uridine-2'-O-)-methyltransferase|uniref:tRNA (cytidine(34)-2'-O)-methyltransferase n=1 Tax=Sphingomonas sanguinis TaxID=33051 RepID=A0A7Y7QVE2_9SPHN|nr:TrmH family RNA methyltransferase [Sphingomonas sanguinis]MBZ6382123.1 tRNA (cytidine(34)-2'-O)-methyltransferase [Sphingomonas sanguinis]NNG49070.1 tRNA (cytidine(34)-2'-O)-methyltransferase [Sphingomonas sanguinis]NNG52679.1 tRNA (cytidine(34)-2'-O)-methyltransferase [Sphingomonas sanguinis]NVP31422.1 tRNA (cytidine(34)-2'-O)-methyltransferase [Sphingomonas sanguinis]